MTPCPTRDTNVAACVHTPYQTFSYLCLFQNFRELFLLCKKTNKQKTEYKNNMSLKQQPIVIYLLYINLCHQKETGSIHSFCFESHTTYKFFHVSCPNACALPRLASVDRVQWCYAQLFHVLSLCYFYGSITHKIGGLAHSTVQGSFLFTVMGQESQESFIVFTASWKCLILEILGKRRGERGGVVTSEREF